MFNEKFDVICKELGWKTCWSGKSVSLMNTSPFGTAIHLYLSSEDFINEVIEYEDEFNESQYIERKCKDSKNKMNLAEICQDSLDVHELLTDLKTAVLEVK